MFCCVPQSSANPQHSCMEECRALSEKRRSKKRAAHEAKRWRDDNRKTVFTLNKTVERLELLVADIRAYALLFLFIYCCTHIGIWVRTCWLFFLKMQHSTFCSVRNVKCRNVKVVTWKWTSVVTAEFYSDSWVKCNITKLHSSNLWSAFFHQTQNNVTGHSTSHWGLARSISP